MKEHERYVFRNPPLLDSTARIRRLAKSTQILCQESHSLAEGLWSHHAPASPKFESLYQDITSSRLNNVGFLCKTLKIFPWRVERTQPTTHHGRCTRVGFRPTTFGQSCRKIAESGDLNQLKREIQKAGQFLV